MKRLDRPLKYERTTHGDQLAVYINDQNNLAKIIGSIFNELNIQPTKPDMDSIIEFIPQVDPSYLFNKFGNDLTKINAELKTRYINYRKQIKEQKNTDTQVMLNAIMKGVKGDEGKYGGSKVTPQKSGFAAAPTIPFDLSAETLIKFAKILNFKSLWKDVYIELDSRYQNISNTDRSLISYSIVSNTKVKQIGSGAITAIGDIQDIVQIEIVGFNIPYLAQADNFYKRITMTIVPLVSDCYETYENGQYHFSFRSELVGNLIYLRPDRPEYRFRKPINRIGDMTIRFGSPLVPITFDKDRLIISSIDYSSSSGEITFAESHNLISGDIIYIDSFSTYDNAKHLTIVGEINRLLGHTITRISNSIIAINIDFSSIDVGDRNTVDNIEVYFASKRIMIPLRIRYLMNQ